MSIVLATLTQEKKKENKDKETVFFPRGETNYKEINWIVRADFFIKTEFFSKTPTVILVPRGHSCWCGRILSDRRDVHSFLFAHKLKRGLELTDDEPEKVYRYARTTNGVARSMLVEELSHQRINSTPT